MMSVSFGPKAWVREMAWVVFVSAVHPDAQASWARAWASVVLQAYVLVAMAERQPQQSASPEFRCAWGGTITGMKL